ncbi:MAG TPA: nuclear transport factor 2 family protein [Sphingopyxis sp.]|uniref:nuclear transport factor 2 family protein n=1 Tax=Sphingopyxis sp. TaxID=1908224 RepID=UPI002B71E497|nr:nuclear transport factor 2 family protein [Sphingopyxis sp.]HWW58886.1 nuclear transport factor 2 family protein [Sphingopyxis sp.]
MVSRETIESRLRQLNAAENSRPNATVEEVSAGIDKVMAPDVHGWRGGVHVPNRAAEREVERAAFGALADYHRTFDILLIEPPYASLRWTIRGSFQGKEIVAPGASFFKFNDDGLVAEYWMHIDPADFAYRS